MSLIELPSNTGSVIGVDPHAVTAVAPYRGPRAGYLGQVFDMSTVWLHDRSLFICLWTPEHVLDVLNTARRTEAELFAAGYHAGIANDRMTADVGLSWKTYLEERHA